MTWPLPPAGVAHLWTARPEAIAAGDVTRAPMTDDEVVRYRRYLSDEARQQYVATRVLVRRVLGGYLGCAPASLRFAEGEHGRPHLATPSPVRFNLSNTRGLVVCLACAHYEVGVDVELASRAPELLGLAPNVFAPAELQGLRDLDAPSRPRRAVDLWTLKEAYIKARGLGLAIPLDGFAFRLEDEARVDIDASLGDHGDAWQFRTLALGPHIVSTAVRCPATAPVFIEVRDASGLQ